MPIPMCQPTWKPRSTRYAPGCLSTPKWSVSTRRPGSRRHVEALSSALATFGKLTRNAIDQANELSDLDTADLFTEVSRGTDKWTWFVEAHLQAER